MEIISLLSFFASPVLFFGMVFLVLRAIQRSKYRQYRFVLEEAARMLGGQFVDTPHPKYIEQMYTTAYIQGTPVTLHFELEGHGRNARWVVRAYVNFGPHMPHYLHVYPETAILSSVGKFLGGQDIQIGYPAYDAQFIIKSHDEHWARAVLREPLLSSHLGRRHVELLLQGGTLLGKHIDSYSTPEQVVDLMQFVGYVANVLVPPMNRQLPSHP